MRIRVILSVVALGLAVGLDSGAASAASPKKPADHHGYRWGAQKLLCTSVRAERRPNDRVIITYKGRRYWCSLPAALGTANLSSVAMGVAIADRFNPADTHPWQVALPGCKRTGPKVFACSIVHPLLTAAATVTWTAAGPKVVFTRFECGGDYAGRAGC